MSSAYAGGAELFPDAVLLLTDDDATRGFYACARPERPRDGVDAVSELAVLALASSLPHAASYIPSRLRDLDDGAVVSRPLVVTQAARLPDGRIDLTAEAVVMLGDPDGDEPPPTVVQPLDPAQSPVASLLCDALLTTDLDLRVEEVVEVLESWGHTVEVLGDLPEVDRARLGRARYRVHRLARELSQRHRPMALAGEDRRPAAPANLPVGFVPACPL